MKQVSLRLKGGLGNQLFIYSFGKMLEKKYKFKIKYDLTTGFIINEYKHIETIKPLLKFYFDDVSEISFFSLIFHQIARKINYPRLFNIQYINEEFDNLEEHLNNLSNTNYNYYLEGYFQSYPLIENILPDYLQDKNIGEILNVMGEATATELKKANRPVRVIYVDDDTINSAVHLMTMLLLEVALIGEIIGVNPFNQPAVERIKDTTKFILDNYDRN